VVRYNGEIIWDTSKPDGTPKRLLDTSKLFTEEENKGFKV
jgi:GDP-L-fucose synthase